jgi:cellobiose epimerase
MNWRFNTRSSDGQDFGAMVGRDEFADQARRCKRILQETVTEFFLPACLDKVNGGYLEVEEDGVFRPGGEKFLLLQARQTWVFSLLAQEGSGTDGALQAAQSGVEFLNRHMRDRSHGGYFATVTDAGEPLDRRKHVGLNVFVLFALARYFLASGDETALTSAKELYRVLEERAWDDQNGGYIEFHSEDWIPITDPKAQNYYYGTGAKTLNTHMHVLETYAELYRAWPDRQLKERIGQLAQIVFKNFRHPLYSHNVATRTPSWSFILRRNSLRANYGHDLESVWFALDACEATGLPVEEFLPRATAISDHCLRRGYDSEHGGFYLKGPIAGIGRVRDKVWWVQAESLVAMLLMFRVTGDPRYYAAFKDVFDFIERHHLAPGGGWWATLHADGTPKSAVRASRWQGGYHTARSMVMNARMLEELAAKGDG